MDSYLGYKGLFKPGDIVIGTAGRWSGGRTFQVVRVLNEDHYTYDLINESGDYEGWAYEKEIELYKGDKYGM